MRISTVFLFALALASCGGKSSPQATSPAALPPSTVAPDASPPPAADPAPAPAATNDVAAQAALAEQYDKGKTLYVAKKCASCHGDHGEGNPKNPAVIGANALPQAAPKGAKLRKGVAFATAKDVLAFVKAKMPIKSPGTLSDDDAAAIVAWMLSESKVNIDKPLDATNAGAIPLR